jgi:hypothetical protein
VAWPSTGAACWPGSAAGSSRLGAATASTSGTTRARSRRCWRSSRSPTSAAWPSRRPGGQPSRSGWCRARRTGSPPPTGPPTPWSAPWSSAASPTRGGRWRRWSGSCVPGASSASTSTWSRPIGSGPWASGSSTRPSGRGWREAATWRGTRRRHRRRRPGRGPRGADRLQGLGDLAPDPPPGSRPPGLDPPRPRSHSSSMGTARRDSSARETPRSPAIAATSRRQPGQRRAR